MCGGADSHGYPTDCAIAGQKPRSALALCRGREKKSQYRAACIKRVGVEPSAAGEELRPVVVVCPLPRTGPCFSESGLASRGYAGPQDARRESYQVSGRPDSYGTRNNIQAAQFQPRHGNLAPRSARLARAGCRVFQSPVRPGPGDSPPCVVSAQLAVRHRHEKPRRRAERAHDGPESCCRVPGALRASSGSRLRSYSLGGWWEAKMLPTSRSGSSAVSALQPWQLELATAKLRASSPSQHRSRAASGKARSGSNRALDELQGPAQTSNISRQQALVSIG